MPGPGVWMGVFDLFGAVPGCWDFWGEDYTGEIMNQNSVQARSIINMVTAMGATADHDDDDSKGDSASWSYDPAHVEYKEDYAKMLAVGASVAALATLF